MHEYAEILAYLIEDSEWRYDTGLLKAADNRFLTSCLRKAYSVVDSSMNERKTKAGRRNQVLYALGKITRTEFDAKTVELILRKEFPDSTGGIRLAVGQILADLASGDSPLLRRASKAVNYRFADPRYLMCIRLVLTKSLTGEKVKKATFKR